MDPQQRLSLGLYRRSRKHGLYVAEIADAQEVDPECQQPGEGQIMIRAGNLLFYLWPLIVPLASLPTPQGFVSRCRSSKSSLWPCFCFLFPLTSQFAGKAEVGLLVDSWRTVSNTRRNNDVPTAHRASNHANRRYLPLHPCELDGKATSRATATSGKDAGATCAAVGLCRSVLPVSHSAKARRLRRDFWDEPESDIPNWRSSRLTSRSGHAFW